MSTRRLILVTGATGYVGGRLLPALLARGEHVRCLARRPEAIAPRPGLEVVAGDALDAEAVRRALDGVDVAYYLIHAMGAAAGFQARDRQAATLFAEAARDACVRRIVYLGGLGSGPDLSTHLASRQEVGRLLASTGVETIEFRASIVIGSGSLSFELVRSLTERLPVMVTPRWVRTRAQPIAIEDVIAYLVAALDLEAAGSEVFEIGGAAIATYGELMGEYARQRGLHRLLVPVPVLTPRLSGLWLGLVTPVYARVGRTLVESLPHETVVHDPSALERFPIRPRGYREAIARALLNEDEEIARTRWSDALSAGGRRYRPASGAVQGRLVDSRVREVPVAPQQAFAPIRRIGGDTGWYYGNTLWRLRDTGVDEIDGFHCRKWRRRYIETYLVWPPALAAASGVSEVEIAARLRDDHGIAISAENFTRSNAPSALLDLRAKEILMGGDEAILAQLPITAIDVAHAMPPESIPEDIVTILSQLNELA